jgi:cysteine desulfurase
MAENAMRVLTHRRPVTSMKPLYLDYNATSPLDPRVFAEMRPYFETGVGNAGSRTHLYGVKAREGVERARRQVASVLDREPTEVIFTSGATESNNLVLLGLIDHARSAGRRHVLATCIEHKSVLGPLGKLRDLGFEVELIPVTAGGYVEADTVKRRLRSDTLVVTMMHANNETGVMQPVTEVASLVANTLTSLHVDAAQTFGKEIDELRSLDYDFLSISSHKIHGPPGVGALVFRRGGPRRVPVTPLMYGGGQERALRPGTLPVPLIVGFGIAAELAGLEYRDRAAHAERLKRAFLRALSAVDHEINGDQTRAQSHVVNVSFTGIDSEALMIALRSDLAISNGAACTSAGNEPSHVLRAMGLSEDRVASAVRFSWGKEVRRIPHNPLIEAVSRLKW